MDEQEGDYDWVLCKVHQTLKSVSKNGKNVMINQSFYGGYTKREIIGYQLRIV